MNCKYCDSTNTIKFGTYTDKAGTKIQRYYCKDCKRKFTELDTLPKMQTPIDQVSAALRMYYSGMSLDGIQGQLKQQYNNYVAEATIYYWILKFTREAIERSKAFKPVVGDVWIADETGIDIHGNKRDIWFWDIIDANSRYLLASHISKTRTTEDAKMLIQKAILRAGKYPRVIITDKLRAYIDGIDLATGIDKVEHIRSKPFTTENSTNKIERFHGTLKDRTKIIRAFKSFQTAELITEGWLIHYNFFKEHSSLGDTPPAVKMNIPIPFIDWNDIVIQSKQPVPKRPLVNLSFFNRQITKEQQKSEYFRLANKKSKAKRKYQSVSKIKNIKL